MQTRLADQLNVVLFAIYFLSCIIAPSPDKSRVSHPKSKSSSVGQLNEIFAPVIEEKTSPNETLRQPMYSSTPTVKVAPGIPSAHEREASLQG